MTNKSKQQPAETLRDGAMKATIWRNESDNGPFFAVTFARTYTKGDDGPRDTDSFSGSQLLRLARQAEKAYDRTRKLTRAARATDDSEDEEEGA